VQVVIPWLETQPEAYRALCRRWASPEFIAASKKHRECRGNDPKHRYGRDGHLRKAKRMVRPIIANICNDIFISMCMCMVLTHMYRRLKAVLRRVTSKCTFKGIGDKTLHTPSSYAVRQPQIGWLVVLETYWLCIVFSALSSMLYFYCRRNMVPKWSSVTAKAMIGGRNPLTAWPYMLPEAESSMDGEM
jgi:hypothetical protein